VPRSSRAIAHSTAWRLVEPRLVIEFIVPRDNLCLIGSGRASLHAALPLFAVARQTRCVVHGGADRLILAGAAPCCPPQPPSLASPPTSRFAGTMPLEINRAPVLTL